MKISFLSVGLISSLLSLLVANPCTAQEMPGTSPSNGSPTLKDEIDFEKAKLLSYADALKTSKDTQLPLVVYIGCCSNDVTLFLTLKGKVIPCYLQSKAALFTEINSGIVIGLWDSQGQCKRWDMTVDAFKNENLRNQILFPKQPKPQSLNPQSQPQVYAVQPQQIYQIYSAPSTFSRFRNCNEFH